MKKELLRINRLNYNYTRTRKLENVSFCILEGECIGFLGLSYSGKDLMTSLLRGELTEGDGSGAIYLGGQKVNDWEVTWKRNILYVSGQLCDRRLDSCRISLPG